MIVIVAPYSPFDRSDHPNLGASRKIEAVIGILSSLDPDVVLINSAHNREVRSGGRCEQLSIGGRQVLEVTPSTYRNRKVGKLLNLFEARVIVESVVRRGIPQLVWLYNGYAMECLLAREFTRRGAASTILELEDAHFARGRGLNPKPLLDWVAFRRSLGLMKHVFAVNNELRNYASALGPSASLFPGIIQEGLIAACDARTPFQSPDGIVQVGYFGGLTKEKGADKVLHLAAELGAGFKVHVCGAGDMADACRRVAKELGSERLAYHGLVDDNQLNRLIAGCDVILNLHSSIAVMGDGVFPFKVLESVASGRLLISTRVPGDGLDEMLQGVVFVGDEEEDQLRAVRDAAATYMSRKERIQSAMKFTRKGYSTGAFAERIRAIVELIPRLEH